MSMHLTPIEVVAALVAPPKRLGTLLGLSQKIAYNWVRGSAHRDAGDMPPRINRKLLAYAKRHHIPLTADHLIFGACRADLDDLVQQMKRDAADLVAAE